MINPKLEIYASTEELFHTAAQRISVTLAAALAERGAAFFVLTGGNTPKPVYEMLSAPPFRECLDWSRIHLFWGDERCVPPESPKSNYGMTWKILISELSIPSENIHRIFGELEDPKDAARRYETEIRRVFADAPLPAFDLVLLGIGEDGHTASLFPGISWDEERWVVASFVPKLKANRITMTPRLLNTARAVIFLTSGTAKAKALAGVLEDPASIYPAKTINPPSGNLTWMVDRAAAALLNQLHKS